MANEHEDSLPDDPPEEINLDNDDLDDLLGGKEKNEHSDADADDDLLSDDDLLEADSSDEDSGEEDGAEISEEELDSLLADADSPAPGWRMDSDAHGRHGSEHRVRGPRCCGTRRRGSG